MGTAAGSAVHPMAGRSPWGGLGAAAPRVTVCHHVRVLPSSDCPAHGAVFRYRRKSCLVRNQGTSGGRAQRGQEGEVVMRAFLSLLQADICHHQTCDPLLGHCRAPACCLHWEEGSWAPAGVCSGPSIALIPPWVTPSPCSVLGRCCGDASCCSPRAGSESVLPWERLQPGRLQRGADFP